MQGLGSALRSDLFLARRSLGIRLLILLPAIAAALRIVFERLWETQAAARAAIEGGPPPELTLNGYPLLVHGILAGLTILALILTVLAATTLARDVELGSGRLALTRGVSRPAWVVSRFLTLNLAAFLAGGAVFLASWGCAALLGDFGPILDDGFPIYEEAWIRREIFTGLWGAALPLPGVVAAGLLVSSCARSSGVAVAVAMIAALILDVGQNWVETAGRYVYASYLPTLLDRSYLTQVVQCSRGFSDYGFSEQESLLNLVVPIPEALALLALAVGIAVRRKL